MLDWIFSDFTPGGVLSGLTGTAIAGVIVFIITRSRTMIAALVVSNRRYARMEIRKRVRSDEYHAERQKIQLIGAIIGVGSLYCASLMVALANKKDMSAALVALAITLLGTVGFLLFFLEDRYNGAALKLRMRREERRRKRLKARTRGD